MVGHQDPPKLPHFHISAPRRETPSSSRYTPSSTNIRCDAPTEALGNCFPYAVMQQLHREEIRSTLTDEMKVLSLDCQSLREGIVQFVQDYYF